MNVAGLAAGVTLFTGSTIAAVMVYRHLDHPDHQGWSPGAAFILLIINLIQLLALALTLFAAFGSSV